MEENGFGEVVKEGELLTLKTTKLTKNSLCV